MRNAILAAVAMFVTAVPAYAQSTNSPSGGTIVRTSPSGNGGSSGASGSIGSPTPTYPGPLRNFNNPAAEYPSTRLRNPSAPRR